MSLTLLNSIILRTLANPDYTVKGSELTWEELDKNQKIIADAIKELSQIEIAGVEPYNPAEEYSIIGGTGGGPDYVTYDNNTWQFVGATPATGVTPGTDGSVWTIASQGIFSHERNKDTALAQGTADEVTASEIRGFIDASELEIYNVSTTNNTATVIHTIQTELDKIYFISMAILGKRTGGSSGIAGDYMVYEVHFSYRNVAGTVTVGSVNNVVAANSPNAGVDWVSPSRTVSGTTIQLKVTGGTNYDIDWTLKILSKHEI